MADLDLTVNSKIAGRTNWGATWAGVFIFAAIWSTFEMLAIAIFGLTSGPGSRVNPATAIWTIVLTLIAMYVAGRETGRLAQVAEKLDAVVHGMMMFGLSVVAMLVLAALGTGMTGNSLSTYMLNLSPAMRWTIFASLILGGLAAMLGASANAGRRVAKPVDNVRDIRPAA
jgi:SNF family Na+-dependent transporter